MMIIGGGMEKAGGRDFFRNRIWLNKISSVEGLLKYLCKFALSCYIMFSPLNSALA